MDLCLYILEFCAQNTLPFHVYFPNESFANILFSLVSLYQKYTIINILEIKSILCLEFQAANLIKLIKKITKLPFVKIKKSPIAT